MTRADCPTYAPFTQTGTAAPGQVQGTGCVYPESVPTVAGQLSAAGKTWKGYMEDMGPPASIPNPGPRTTTRAPSRATSMPPGTTLRLLHRDHFLPGLCAQRRGLLGPGRDLQSIATTRTSPTSRPPLP